MLRKAGLGLISAFILTSATAVAAEKLTLQTGAAVPYTGMLQFYVAEHGGFFREENLDVEIRYSSGAPQATQLTLAGQSDIGSPSIEPIIQGFERGITGKVLGRINNHLVYWLAVPESSQIKTVQDLSGKKIGVSNLGSAAIPVLRSILRAANVKFDADTFVPVGVFDQAMAALSTGKVDALGLFDGVYFGLERSGQKFRYFKHPTLEKFGNAVLITTKQNAENKRDVFCRFGRAVAKATTFMMENQNAAVHMWWKVSPAAKRGKTEEEAMANGLTEIGPMVAAADVTSPGGLFGEIDEKALTEYINLFKVEGVITQAPTAAELLDTSYPECFSKFDATAVKAAARQWKAQ